jgi:hypothetical protein
MEETHEFTLAGVSFWDSQAVGIVYPEVAPENEWLRRGRGFWLPPRIARSELRQLQAAGKIGRIYVG